MSGETSGGFLGSDKNQVAQKFARKSLVCVSLHFIYYYISASLILWWSFHLRRGQ
jgi:hypothetical protein